MLFNEDKKNLSNWTYSLRVKLVENTNHYFLIVSQIQYSTSYLIEKLLVANVQLRVRNDGIINFVIANDLITIMS